MVLFSYKPLKQGVLVLLLDTPLVSNNLKGVGLLSFKVERGETTAPMGVMYIWLLQQIRFWEKRLKSVLLS